MSQLKVNKMIKHVENLSLNSKQHDPMPISALLALAMTGFICIFTETIPAGLLPQISAGLNVSEALTGQLIAIYALGSMLMVIPLTMWTRKWPRRHTLLFMVFGFLVFNSITALSNDYILTCISRFGAGAAAGLAWSLLAGYARRLVSPAQQGKALAVAMVGTPIALSLGIPLGTWLGQLLGWQMTFFVMSISAIVLVIWILIAVPNFPGETHRQENLILNVLKMPGMLSVLAVIVTWMLAHNILYTYITPFLLLSHLEAHVDQILFLFGAMALLSIFATGHLIDQYLRQLVIVSLFIFSVISLFLGFFMDSVPVVLSSVAIWGLTFGGAATLLQTALAQAAGHHADVALSINVVVWNGAIALGGVLGGLLLNQFGAQVLPWVMLFILIIAFSIALCAKPNGFNVHSA